MNRGLGSTESILMRRLVDRVPSILACWDRDLRCRFANRAFECWFRLAPEAVVGIRLQDVLGPQLFALHEPHVAAVLRGEERMFERLVPASPGGPQRTSLAHYMPDLVEGEVTGLFLQVTEITRIKTMELALRDSETYLHHTGRAAAVGAWDLDLRTQALTWSEQTRRIHEVPEDYQPALASAIAFYEPDAQALITKALQMGADAGHPWDLELPLTTWRGRSIWVRALGEVVHEDGRPVRLVGAVQDITEHRQRRVDLQREQELRMATERHARELDRLSTERGQMLDVLAHEVRQPLNNASAALQAAVAVLSEVREPAAVQRLAKAQRVMGQVMASLDNTLAVATLLGSGQPIHREDTDIDTLLAVTMADMPREERHRLRVERDCRTRTASMDMSLMRLALRNLLSNALTYSDAGSPVVIRLTDSDQPLALVIDVLDCGPGIPALLAPHLFERGAWAGMAGPSMPPRARGLGLGLYIVRRVMELHGGKAELSRDTLEGVTMRLLITQTPDA